MYMTAHKPAFKVGGTSLKDRKALAEKEKLVGQKVETSNPWESLTE